jgi:AraC-like DNA-binding protein
MMLNYTLDITPNSVWYNLITPSLALDLPFYLTELGIFHAKSNYYTERQGNNTFLFLYTLAGEGVVDYKNSQFYLTPYSVILLDCNLYHRYQTVSDTPWIFKWFHFNGTCAHTYTQLLNMPHMSPIYLTEPFIIDNHFDELIKFSNTIDNETLLSIAYQITALFTYLYTNKLNDKKANYYYTYKKDIDNVVGFIHTHYSETINLEDMLSLIHVSKFYFFKIFKYYLGVSPYDYLLHYRITQAKILLRETSKPIGEISLNVGFKSDSQFIKHFKKITHITPLQYRKSCGYN